MENSSLLIKSEENKKAAELLASNSMYIAATSRAYYSLYQKVLHIIDTHPLLEIAQNGDGIKGPHELNISRFELLTLKAHGVYKGQKVVTDLRFLKDVRKSCDYEKDFTLTSQKYKKQVEKKLLDVYGILEAYCNPEKG